MTRFGMRLLARLLLDVVGVFGFHRTQLGMQESAQLRAASLQRHHFVFLVDQDHCRNRCDSLIGSLGMRTACLVVVKGDPR